MASFTDVVKGQVVSIANEGFKRVTGGLRGVIGSAIEDLNPISRIFDQNQSKGKLDPKSFTFPLDVTVNDPGLGNHGHYILFFINEQEDAKIRFGRDDFSFSGSGFLNLIDSRIENGIGNMVNSFVDTQAGAARDAASDLFSRVITFGDPRVTVGDASGEQPITAGTVSRSFVGTGDATAEGIEHYLKTGDSSVFDDPFVGPPRPPNKLKSAVSSLYENVNNFIGLDSIIEGYSNAGLDFVTDKLGFERYGSTISKSRNTAIVERAPTTRLDTAIALYMPPTVNVTYASNYVDTEIGSAANLAGKIFDGADAAQGVANNITQAVNQLMDKEAIGEFADFLRKMGLGAAGIIPGAQGARELYEMKQGSIMTNRMELAFKGLPKRSFQYTFKMIPKSEKEANEVRNIVNAFKINMLPEMVDSSTKRLRVPNTFDIKYMYVGQENEYLHKISTCVLENMNVTYGGDRYKTFEANAEGAPPVETTITLNFKEMEQITRERAREGF